LSDLYHSSCTQVYTRLWFTSEMRSIGVSCGEYPMDRNFHEIPYLQFNTFAFVAWLRRRRDTYLVTRDGGRLKCGSGICAWYLLVPTGRLWQKANCGGNSEFHLSLTHRKRELQEFQPTAHQCRTEFVLQQQMSAHTTSLL
jgi:hypothetical protein